MIDRTKCVRCGQVRDAEIHQTDSTDMDVYAAAHPFVDARGVPKEQGGWLSWAIAFAVVGLMLAVWFLARDH